VPDPAEVARLYAKAVESGDYDAVWSTVMTDRVFAIPATRLVEAHAAQSTAGTYLYVFEWASPAFGGKLGSCHALEVPFVFDNLAQPGVSVFAGANPPQALADQMHKAWAAFARTGDPNHAGLPTWPAYDGNRRSTMHFGPECRVEDDPRANIRQVWEGII
jgi:para-nitrobenzyl esterase